VESCGAVFRLMQSTRQCAIAIASMTCSIDNEFLLLDECSVCEAGVLVIFEELVKLLSYLQMIMLKWVEEQH